MLINARSRSFVLHLVHRRYESSANIAQRGIEINGNVKDYQYIQRSELPTMYFQRSLPRLPIPKLDQTCQRYLNSVQQLLNEEDFLKCKEETASFSTNGLGQQLQAALIQYDSENKHTSYISQLWYDMYLSDRVALPLNYSPLLVMNNETRSEYNSQLVRACNLIISSLRFWRSLRGQLLEPEIFHLNSKRSDTKRFRQFVRLLPPYATYLAYIMKAYPLDMSQYDKLFGLTRVPQIDKDVLKHHTDSRHILIMRQGNMYAFDVLNKDNGDIEQPKTIYARLKAIIDADNKRQTAAVPLGALTTCDRDYWANIRTKLLKSAHNKHLLEEIVDKALFCVCLDGEDEPTYNEDNPVPIYKNLLAGNSKNRWFDKSLSLLLASDGTTAVNFEHSWGDGVAVLRYFNEIYKDTCENPFVNIKTCVKEINCDDKIRHLDFDFADSDIKTAAIQAESAHNNKLKQLNMHIMRCNNLHKQLCKEASLSADAIMQLAFQLAFYKAFNQFVGSYESCSTAAFRHGRTEAVRPCSSATKKFCLRMNLTSDKQASSEELYQLLTECSQVHSQLTREAAMGQGFDRHLFALKHMATLKSTDLPLIFKSSAYARHNYNIISTSTLNSSALLAGAFGPVVPDGLGIGYSIQNEFCGAIVTSYDGQRDAKLFMEKLEESFDQLQIVINTQVHRNLMQ